MCRCNRLLQVRGNNLEQILFALNYEVCKGVIPNGCNMGQKRSSN